MRDWSNRLRGGRGTIDTGRWRNRRRGPPERPAAASGVVPAERPPLAGELLTPFLAALRVEAAGLTLRPAAEGDIPALRALVIADTDAALGEEVPPAVRSLMGSLQLDGRRPVIAPVRPDTLDAVVLRKGAVIGRVVLRQVPGGVRLLDITMLPDKRRQGLGGGVLRALAAAADDLGWSVSARVWFDSPAKSLFRRAGFVKVGETAVDDLLERRPSRVPASPPA